jgi:DNA-binding response OmpR family regulator
LKILLVNDELYDNKISKITHEVEEKSIELSQIDELVEILDLRTDSKSISMHKLCKKIINIINSMDNIVKISEYMYYDIKKQELYIANKEDINIKETIIPLRKKERRLLTILIKNKNSTVKINSINNYVWEENIKDEYPIRQLVAELRKKLPQDKNYITADVGIGYKILIN